MTEPRVLVNGETTAALSVFDRGLLYGDGLFETVRHENGRLSFWPYHLKRLNSGLVRLGFAPLNEADLRAQIERLSADLSYAVVKIIVTRGQGARGFRPPAAECATVIVMVYPRQQPFETDAVMQKVRLCSTPLPLRPHLAGLKHLNCLDYVMARQEWAAEDADEGVLLDTQGYVIEATQSNLFLIREGSLITPALDQTGVAGVMRALVLETAESLAWQVHVDRVTLDAVKSADEMFLTNTIMGLAAVRQFENTVFTSHEKTEELRKLLKEKYFKMPTGSEGS